MKQIAIRKREYDAANPPRAITVRYSSIDGYRKAGRFRTLSGARKFAKKWVGDAPDMSHAYAVSGDGVGKITVEGATLGEVFPAVR